MRRCSVIPRVARSGNSFHGAGAYYLHDKPLTQEANKAFEGIGDYALHDKGQRQTAHRVGFTQILNMEASTPEEAIAQMGASYEAYRAKEAHKRGRKLTQPVYTYSLAWTPDQTPTPEEMQAAALSSLKALRLEGLQTLIVQHTDEPQPHIHLIINRIERDGSHARNIPFDKLRFSRWAEQYEREHGGIVCDERVKNNELRQQGVWIKDQVSLTPAEYKARETAQRDELQNWRREQDRFRKSAHRHQKEVLWARHSQERNALEQKTHARISKDRVTAKERFRPEWNKLYKAQQARSNELAFANRNGILERAVFLYRHKEFLKSTGPLRARDIMRFALSGKALAKRVARAHEAERVTLAKWERTLSEGAVRIAWREHRQDFEIMRQPQELERDGLAYVQQAEWQSLTLERKAGLDLPPQEKSGPVVEHAAPVRAPEIQNEQSLSPSDARQFIGDAPAVQKSFEKASKRRTGKDHADDVVRRMKEYKKCNPGRDFDHEM